MSAPLAVTVGAGRKKPGGARVSFPADLSPAKAIAKILEELPEAPEVWWSSSVFENDYRIGERWESSSAVALDVEHVDDKGRHAAWTPESEKIVREALVNLEFPGSVAHMTPRGLRLVFPLASPATDAETWRRAVDGAVALVTSTDLPGVTLNVDTAASRDTARFFWGPRAIVGGKARSGKVLLLRDQAWTLEELTAHANGAQTRTAPRESGARDGERIPEGERHITLVKLAAELRSKGLNANEILGAIGEVNKGRCEPPLPDSEVWDIARWSGRKDSNEPLGGTPKPTVGGRSAEPLRQVGSRPPAPWADPEPIAEVEPCPDFPTDLIRADWLRDFVDAVAAETFPVPEGVSTPKALPALQALAMVGLAVARKISVHVHNNWTETLNLYVLNVLDSGQLKTPVYKMLTAPFALHEERKTKEMRDAVTKAENERQNLTKLLDGTRRRMAQAKTETERAQLTKETEKLAKRLDDHVVPRAPRLTTGDATEEALGRLLAENDGRIGVVSDEGGPFRNMSGRYQVAGTPLFEIFKHGHNGGTVRVDRIGRQPVHVPLSAITLAVMCQPYVLKTLKDVPALRGEGLLGRILYGVQDSIERDGDRAVGVPHRVAEDYRKHITRLIELPFAADQVGAPVPHVLELSAEARALVNPFRNSLERRKARGGDLSPLSDWTGKAAGQTVRIAALLHIAEIATDPEPWRTPVSADAMRCAIEIAERFLIPNALAAYDLMCMDPEVGLAEDIVAWIRKVGEPRFTKRDLHRRLKRGRVKKPVEWDEPLGLLREKHYIRRVPTPGTKMELYDVNPKILPAETDEPPSEHGDAWEGPDHE